MMRLKVEFLSRRGILGPLVAGILLCGLAACGKFSAFERDTTVVDGVAGADLTARQPARLPQGGDRESTMGAQVYPGAPQSVEASSSQPLRDGVTSQSGEGYNINFNNADIAAVAKALLGDALGHTYSVDQRIKGTISLNSGRPVPRSQVLPLLETVLKYAGATVIHEGGLYKITPANEELGAGSVQRPGGRMQPGHGVTVLPLQYVSAPIIMRALDSFAVRPGMLRADQSRNVLLIIGTSPERARAMEAAMALDVDWIKTQSVGIFPVSSANPETVIAELQNVFDAGKEGATGPLVRFQPIQRLNAVLAIAQTPGMIDQVRRWVTRLDRADYANTAVRVYRVRYGNARVMANILREVFTGQPSIAAPAAADLSQLTPGSSMQRSSTESGSSTVGSSTSGMTPSATPSTSSSSSSGTSSTQPTSLLRSSDPTSSGLLGSSSAGSQPPLLPNARVSADTANNSLLIYADRNQYKIIERAIRELDRAPMQVAIDVTIAEITLKNDLQYGVQFYIGNNPSGSLGFGVNDILPTLVPGASNIVFGARDNPRVVINALRRITDVKVLSSPSLVVVDNQQAMLQVGDEVPIATQSSQSVVTPGAPVINTIEMRNTGVILRVTPRVNANGNVMLDIIQEISNVVRGESSLTPTISQRRIQSSLSVASGQTVLLGGLISTRQERGKTGIPILSEIKIIGDLLGQHSKLTDRTELIMFIRPQVIRNGVDAQLVAEELRSKLNLLSRGRSGPRSAAPPRR
jgi:general secretion pathway protein D